jgi:phosphatidylserine/phosphatidylglycerophosphate/cardiolipin synthase-like enzyme
MARFLTEKELYPEVKKRSKQTKNILWVCSPYLGTNAHEIFSEEIAKNPPKDIRLLFRLEKRLVEKGMVNPNEIEYFQMHIKNCQIRTNSIFHSKIYIFDDSALVTSANLSKTAFEKSIEAGVILTGQQVEKVKRRFERLWETSGPIGDLDDYKKAWKTTPMTSNTGDNHSKPKVKNHTNVVAWDEDTENKLLTKSYQTDVKARSTLTTIVKKIFEENLSAELYVSWIIHEAQNRFPFETKDEEIARFQKRRFNKWVRGRIDYFKDKGYIIRVKRGTYRKN